MRDTVDNFVHTLFQLTGRGHNHKAVIDLGAETFCIAGFFVDGAQFVHDLFNFRRFHAVILNQAVKTADLSVMYPRQAELFRRFSDKHIGCVPGWYDF